MMSQAVLEYSDRFLMFRRKSWIEHWLIGMKRSKIEGMISSLKDRLAVCEASFFGSLEDPVIRSATPMKEMIKLTISIL